MANPELTKLHSPRGSALLQVAFRTVHFGLLILALALGAWHVARFAEHSRAALAYLGPLDGQEGTLLHEARLILRGEPLYQPLRLDRVVGAPYPPLHAYALAGAERLAHGDAPPRTVDDGPLFRAGRLISLGSMLAAALLIGLAAWRLGGGPLPGAIAAALLLAAPPAQLWATRIKPDPLALALTAGGLLCAALALAGRPGQGGGAAGRGEALLIGAALLFAAAYFTKQTYIAAPLAVGLALLLGRPAGEPARSGPIWRRLLRGRRPLLVFALSYGLSVGVSWLAIDLATAGQLSFHVWGLHPPEWWIYGRFLRYLGLLGPAWPLALLCALGLGLGLGAALRGRRMPSAGELLPWLYAGLGTATLVGAGTIGSHHNHLLEPTLALTLGGCVAAGRAGRWEQGERGRGGAGRGPLAAGAALLAAALLLAQGWSYIGRPEWYGGEFDLSEENWRRFVELLRSQPGEVLSDDVGLMLLAGKEPRYDDPPTMGPAARSGLWDQSGLLREVAERRFDLILLHFDAAEEEIDAYGRWSPEFIAALQEHYRPLYRDLYYSFVPRE